MATSAFPQSVELTAIAMAVSNRQMIADDVLPRTSPLAKHKFSYQWYDPAQFFSVLDTRVGRRGNTNRVEFRGEQRTAETMDYGLEHGLPQSDVNDAPDNTNLEGLTTEWLMNLTLLDREVRCARIVFNPASYAGNAEVVAASDRFDNPTSDPLEYLLDVLDRPLMRPNEITLGQREWRVLRQNPAIVKAVHGNLGDKGAVTRQQVADLLEINAIHVGQSLLNIARPGRPAEMRSCWAGGMALLYTDRAAAKISGLVDGAVTFGFTAQTGQRVAGSWFDKDIGLRGGTMVRAGESVLEVVSGPCCGYFLQDVVTPQ